MVKTINNAAFTQLQWKLSKDTILSSDCTSDTQTVNGNSNWYQWQGSDIFSDKNYRTFPGLSSIVKTFFQDLLGAHVKTL